MASNDISIRLDDNSEHFVMVLSSIVQTFDEVLSSIVQTFDEGASDAKYWSIHKVPFRLSEVNGKAYVPNVISIGPYHHHWLHLEAMEVIKRSCFYKILEETKLERSTFLEAMKFLEEKARKCYEDSFGYLDSDKFAEMMVYDGCFIVQLIRKIYPEEDYFKPPRIQTDIRYDLLLLENQLPFFVLCKLYSMIVPNGGGDPEFTRLALSTFKKRGRGPEIWLRSEIENCSSPEKDIKHLLDLVHKCCRPSQQNQQHQYSNANKRPTAEQPESQLSWTFIRSATELEEAGIKFFAIKDQGQRLLSLFDIEFTENTQLLKIPTLHVDENTERILRNLMAYEQFIPSRQPTYVSDYAVFMDNLINTGKDVQLLCNSGIIVNCLGDDEAVAQMFHKLRDFIYWSEDFYYAEIFGRVNKHCQKKWNKWKATLNRDYFNTPWSLISVLAAVVLLLLTLLQTIFSVLSYFQ